MTKPKNANIAPKLMLGFFVLIVIFLLFGVYALYDIHKVSDLGRTIYNHPLVVSNAALHANVSIVKMHRSIKDVVLFNSLSKIEKSIEAVNEEEKQVYRQLDIIKKNILGKEGKALEKETRKLCDGWRPIRNEVIRLVHSDQRENAADITIGKGADHVSLLEANMLRLTQYARNKAFEFNRETESIQSKLNVKLIFFLVLGVLTFLLVAFFTLKLTLSAEKGLLKSEERYRSLIEDQIDLVCRITPDGKFVFVNDMYCQFFNKSKKELIGSKWQPPPVDDDIQIIKEKISELSFTNPIVIIENREISGKGSIHWMQFINHGLFDARENLLEIQSVGRDITERKLAEEKLKATEANLKNTFDISPSIISKANLDTGYFSEVSPIVTKILGFSVEEFTSRPLMEFVHPDDRQRTIDEISGQLQGKAVTYFENRYLCKDGSYKWIAWQATPHDKKGIVTAIGSDITERKRAEEALKKAQRLLTETEKIGKVGGWQFNIDTERMTWTKELYNIHEIDSTDDLTLTKGVNFYTPDSKPIIERAVRRAINHGESFDLELEIITAKGNLRTVHAIGKADTKHHRVHGFFQDITTRKMLQKESEKNKTILLEAENLAGFGGWQWDIGKNSWTLSQNWLKIHGCSNRHLATEELIKIAYPEDIPKIQKAFDRVVKEGGTYHIEHRIIHQTTGEIKYIHAYGEARLNDSGKAVEIFGATQDITERKKLEARVLQTQKMESIGTLAGGVAHEINNPINGIMNYAQLRSLSRDLSPKSFLKCT